MRIGIDLDGVMVDFQGTWMDLYVDYFGPPEWYCGADEYFEVYSTYDALTKHTHFEDWAQFNDWFHRAGGWRRVGQRWITGARGAVDALLDAGHRIAFITNRPAHAQAATHEWFTTSPWFEHSPVALYIRADKWAVPGVDVYIDDTPSMIEQLRANGKNCVVFDQPWNDEVDGPRAFGWDPETIELIQSFEVTA